MTITEFDRDYELLSISADKPSDMQGVYTQWSTKDKLRSPLFVSEYLDGIDYRWEIIHVHKKNSTEILEGVVGHSWDKSDTVIYPDRGDAPIVRPPELHTAVIGNIHAFEKGTLDRMVEGKWAHYAYVHAKLWYPEDIKKAPYPSIREFCELVDMRLHDLKVFDGMPKIEEMHNRALKELYSAPYKSLWLTYGSWKGLWIAQRTEMPAVNHAQILFYSLYRPILSYCHKNENFYHLENHMDKGKKHEIFKHGIFHLPLIA